MFLARWKVSVMCFPFLLLFLRGWKLEVEQMESYLSLRNYVLRTPTLRPFGGPNFLSGNSIVSSRAHFLGYETVQVCSAFVLFRCRWSWRGGRDTWNVSELGLECNMGRVCARKDRRKLLLLLLGRRWKLFVA